MNDVIELPDSTSLGAIGQPLRRKEDERLLTGRGRFGDDFTLPGQSYAVVVRSPHPHARIVEIDTRRALTMPGVLGILTGQDCAADGLSPIPHNPVPQTRYDMKLTGPGGGPIFIGPQMLLPSDRVRHVGEAVAVIIAETALQAQDAAEEVAVDYRELPWIAQIKGALTLGAIAVWDEVPDNVLVDTFFGDPAATERAFAIADHIVEMEFHVGRVTGVPMEPRAALGHWDAATGRGTLWAGSGGAVRQKIELAAVLGIPPDRVRVVSLDVGGNFGTRNRLYVESGLVLWASRKLGRPVKYTSTRSEVFLTDFQGRDLLTRVALAIRADGKFLGLRADNVSNVGARCASLSPLGKGSALVTGSYDIPAATLRSRAVFTNTMPTNAYRSSGRPEVTYAIERVVDEAARRLGIDRVALRRMNLVGQEAMPYPNAVGARYDSGTYEANMDLAMEIADWDGFAARRRSAQARGKLLGLGLANYVESSIGAPRERSEITITSEGRVKVVIGTGPSGQGHETSFAQVVGAVLAVPVETIDVVTGDTDIVSLGGGSHSGRSMRHSALRTTDMTSEIDRVRRIKPENNSWYLIATLYGQPTPNDRELQARNRRAWNRYISRWLTADDRFLLNVPSHAEETAPFSAEELADFEKAFIERHRSAGSTASIVIPELKPDDQIDLSNVDFSRPFWVDGFFFPVASNFTRATFIDASSFKGAFFFDMTNFEGATFSAEAHFDGATFPAVANFAITTFSANAYFAATTFSGEAVFERAIFSAEAHFEGGTFSGGALFPGATFSGMTYFGNATFSNLTHFEGATFSGVAYFDGATFSGMAVFRKATFFVANFRDATFSSIANFGEATSSSFAFFNGTTFSDLAQFEGATFRSTTSFVNAEMKGPTSFEAATFSAKPPSFLGAKLHEGTVWRRVKWPTPPMHPFEAGEFVDAYACLKLEMDRLKKHDDELDFFALELQSRRVLRGDWKPISMPETIIVPRSRKLLGRSFAWPPFTMSVPTITLYRPTFGLAIAVYGRLCDYGRSYVRPLSWVLVTVAAGALLFWLYFGPTKFWQAVGLSLANTFGVLGFRKDFIKPQVIETLPGLLKVVAALQTTAGTVLLFLFGLALRNRFRMK